jgi:hypothetical protein
MNSDRTPEQIRERAYQLWERNGRRHGHAQDDWLEAERELGELEVRSASRAVDESVKQSFPASDPPATRRPDEPPVNAEAKWVAASSAQKEGRGEGARRARGSIRRQ